MKRWLRGGPAWTTRLRLIVALPLLFVLTVIVGAIKGVGEYLGDFCGGVRAVWRESNRPGERR